MKKTVYNKLVRDNIPSIIKNEGKKCTYHLAPEEDRLSLLRAKVLEEAHELVEASTDINDIVEELADILTVIDEIMDTDPRARPWVIRRMILKENSKGGFRNLVILESVEEEEDE